MPKADRDQQRLKREWNKLPRHKRTLSDGSEVTIVITRISWNWWASLDKFKGGPPTGRGTSEQAAIDNLVATLEGNLPNCAIGHSG